MIPTTVIATASNPEWGEFRGLTLLGCTLATIDRQAKRVLVFDDKGTLLFRIGKTGFGPGELDDPVVLATDGDSTVLTMDVSRRRLLSYSTSGSSVADEPLQGGPSVHAAMGRMLYVSPDTLLDFWLTANGPFPLPNDLFDTLHLVTALHRDGTVWPGGWGRPLRPANDSALMLRMGLQAGDMAVWRDTLFVLRAVPGLIDVFPLNASSYSPVRTIELNSWRRHIPPSEEGTRIVTTPDGDRFANEGEVEVDVVALALDVDATGSVYVVQLTNELAGADHLSPHEVLAVYSRAGKLQHSLRLPSLGSQAVKVLPDGRVAILGILESDELGGRALMIFPSLGLGDSSACDLPARHAVAAAGR